MSTNLHKLFRAARIRKGYTYEQMSDLVNRDESTYRYWEQGNRKFTSDELIALFQTLYKLAPEMFREIMDEYNNIWYFSRHWRWAHLFFIIIACFIGLHEPLPVGATPWERFLHACFPPFYVWFMTLPFVAIYLYYYFPSAKGKTAYVPTPEEAAAIAIMRENARKVKAEMPKLLVKTAWVFMLLLCATVIYGYLFPEQQLIESKLTQDLLMLLHLNLQGELLLAAFLGWGLITRSRSLLRIILNFVILWTIGSIVLDMEDAIVLGVTVIYGLLFLLFNINKTVNELEAKEALPYKILDIPMLE